MYHIIITTCVRPRVVTLDLMKVNGALWRVNIFLVTEHWNVLPVVNHHKNRRIKYGMRKNNSLVHCSSLLKQSNYTLQSACCWNDTEYISLHNTYLHRENIIGHQQRWTRRAFKSYLLKKCYLQFDFFVFFPTAKMPPPPPAPPSSPAKCIRFPICLGNSSR